MLIQKSVQVALLDSDSAAPITQRWPARHSVGLPPVYNSRPRNHGWTILILFASFLLGPLPLLAQTFGRCHVDEFSHGRLMTRDGASVYVQPLIAEPGAAGDLFIAGLFNVIARDSEHPRVSRLDSVFGVIVHKGSIADVVRSPVASRLVVTPRTVALDNRRWAAVFGETVPYNGTDRPHTTSQLWFGFIEDTTWTHIERIPLPEGLRVLRSHTSSLVHSNGTFLWAIATQGPSGVLLLSRNPSGRWSSEIVRSGATLYPQLADAGTAGLVLTAVYPDPGLPSDGSSLFLWRRRQAEWVMQQKLASSDDGRVTDSHIVAIGDTAVLVSWSAATGSRRRVAKAIVVSDGMSQEPTPFTLDASIASNAAIHYVATTPHGSIWVVDHLPPDGRSRQIRVLLYDGTGVVALTQLDNPYFTRFGVATVDNEIVVIGGVADPERASVRSTVLRTYLMC